MHGQATPVREVILDSWRRSAMVGLTAARFSVPYQPDIPTSSRLAWAAASALDRAADDLHDTPMALLLADEHGHVLARRDGTSDAASLAERISLAPGFVYAEEVIGTNAIGTALELRAPCTASRCTMERG